MFKQKNEFGKLINIILPGLEDNRKDIRLLVYIINGIYNR